jgi:hypothetical protein
MSLLIGGIALGVVDAGFGAGPSHYPELIEQFGPGVGNTDSPVACIKIADSRCAPWSD